MLYYKVYIFTDMKQGALPSQAIRKLINKGYLQNVKDSAISPASIDICTSSERYRINSIFLPKHGESVYDHIKKQGGIPHAVDQPLEKGVIYAFKIEESCSLPKGIYGYCNPKSSTGRHDLHVRIICDGVARYDTIPSESKGSLWAIIVARSYPVFLPSGFPVSQIRFFSKDTRFTEKDLVKEWQKSPLAFTLEGKPYTFDSFRMKDGDGSLLLTLDLSQDVVGYECRGSGNILDLNVPVGSISPTLYFEPIKRPENKEILLKKDSFYILSTKEALRVPPYLASEMVDMDSRSGEFRSHYAGFFDPGWGCGRNGKGKGRPITLEVRPFEDIIVSHGQPIGKVRFEKMLEDPVEHYDTKVTSHYTSQSGPKLAKQFSQYDTKS